MPEDERYDVIIIGTGAGGGTLAHQLAPTGARILLLERGGDRLPAAGARTNWSSEVDTLRRGLRAFFPSAGTVNPTLTIIATHPVPTT